MTLQDLSNYTVLVKEPIQIDYRGYKLYSTGAPSSGAVALSTLKTIEGYELGDPDFDEGIYAFEAEMLKPSTAAHIRSRISDHSTKNVSEYNPKGFFNPESHGTSHIVTADTSGMSITLTTTINLLFGSKVIVPDSGNYLSLFLQ
jgi:gamma-glutamyltranspeptidase/glutathione hydrolase